VFKPKDEEPYGRLNPKVHIYSIQATLIVLIGVYFRLQNGYTDS